jgi:hypothetical protein
VGTEEFRLPVGFKSLLKLEQLRAYFAENLGAFLSVVEVEVDVWRATAGADDMRWNR